MGTPRLRWQSVALVAAAGWAAACGTAEEIESWCTEACDCYSCSDDDLDACIAQKEAGLAVAEAYECEEEWLSVMACEADERTCNADDLFVEECPEGRCPCESDRDDYEECVDDASKLEWRCECACVCTGGATLDGLACTGSYTNSDCCSARCEQACASANMGGVMGTSGSCRR